MNCSWPLLFIQVRFHLLQLQGACEISVFLKYTRWVYTEGHGLPFSHKSGGRDPTISHLLMTEAHTLTFSCWQRLWGERQSPFVVQRCMRSELFRVKAASLLLHQPTTSNNTFSNYRQHLLLKPELVCGESP